MSAPSPTGGVARRTLFAAMCDDAAVFPPGNLPLSEAVPAHLRHRRSVHAELVGPFVVAASQLDEVGRVIDRLPVRPSAGELKLAVTTPLDGVRDAVAGVAALPDAELTVLEVALGEGDDPTQVVAVLDEVAVGENVTAFVEVPRDERRERLLNSLATSNYIAKFRTGGVRAELYPDERELARSVRTAISEGVSFKATAGLHHALRNTDPETGFEQHGFLNLLAATGAALNGADETEMVDLLAERDGTMVARLISEQDPQVRAWFRSFGSCSIAEPLEELVALGLLDDTMTKELA